MFLGVCRSAGGLKMRLEALMEMKAMLGDAR